MDEVAWNTFSSVSNVWNNICLLWKWNTETKLYAHFRSLCTQTKMIRRISTSQLVIYSFISVFSPSLPPLSSLWLDVFGLNSSAELLYGWIYFCCGTDFSLWAPIVLWIFANLFKLHLVFPEASWNCMSCPAP